MFRQLKRKVSVSVNHRVSALPQVPAPPTGRVCSSTIGPTAGEPFELASHGDRGIDPPGRGEPWAVMNKYRKAFSVWRAPHVLLEWILRVSHSSWRTEKAVGMPLFTKKECRTAVRNVSPLGLDDGADISQICGAESSRRGVYPYNMRRSCPAACESCRSND